MAEYQFGTGRKKWSSDSMRMIRVAVIGVTSCFTFAGAVEAEMVTVSFDSQPVAWHTSVFTDNGFDIDPTVMGANPNYALTATWANFAPQGPDNGTIHLHSRDATTVFSITESTGKVFSLLNFDGAESHEGLPGLWAQAIQVTGLINGGGTVTASFSLDGIQDGFGGSADFESFVLPSTFSNLVEVQFRGIGPNTSTNWYHIDNLDFDTVTSTPEPVSMALLGLTGIGGIGLRWRQWRKARNAQAAA
jgi:hypothetical protein